MPKHTFDNDPSLNLKNLYSSRPVPAAIAINNILTMYVCFEIIIFLQGLNLKSITSVGGSLLVAYAAEELLEQGPSLPVCHYNTVKCALARGTVKGSTGTYLLSCKMIFCLFKRYRECVWWGISDLRVIKIWAHITQGLCT